MRRIVSFLSSALVLACGQSSMPTADTSTSPDVATDTAIAAADIGADTTATADIPDVTIPAEDWRTAGKYPAGQADIEIGKDTA